jgi:hypothetical protein
MTERSLLNVAYVFRDSSERHEERICLEEKSWVKLTYLSKLITESKRFRISNALPGFKQRRI